MKTHLEVIEEWFRRVWREEDASAIDELFIPDGNACGLGSEPLVGPEEFKGFHRLLLCLIKDVNIKVVRHMENDDWISVMAVVNGKRKDNNAPVEMTGQIWLRIVDGTLVEGHNQFDFLKLFEQLGLIPSMSFEQCLQGQKMF